MSTPFTPCLFNSLNGFDTYLFTVSVLNFGPSVRDLKCEVVDDGDHQYIHKYVHI